jgi:parallel beta-helix repeat protein
MKKLLILPILFITLFSCDEDVFDDCGPLYKTCLTFGPGEEAAIEEALLAMTDSTRIILEAGNYAFENLSVDGINTFMIQGAGKESTILDFSSQTSGGEGLRVNNSQNVILRGFKLMDSKGDLVKLNQCTNIILSNIAAVWNEEADSTAGGYGLYPVLCSNILIDSCYVQGASDAGIYVGQSDNAVVRNSEATKNVAGCEIENTTNANVYDNEFHDNAAGLLIFDLPGLSKKGGNVKAYNNYIHDNNFANFAPAASGGTTGVGNVPPGSGIVLVAMSDVEIYNNIIENNNLASIEVVSGFVLDPNAADFIGPNYFPFPQDIFIHDNTMSKSATIPQTTKDHPLGFQLNAIHEGLLFLEAGIYTEFQHIVIDGLTSEDGTPNADNLCIDEAEAQLFLDADLARAGTMEWQYSLDVTPYVCE